MKFRKKPVVIEAVQLREDTLDELYRFMGIEGKGCFQDCGHGIDPADGQFKITTLEGVHAASVGDWIIRGVKGEFYPCKPDIFAATYEPAEDVANIPVCVTTDSGQGECRAIAGEEVTP